MDCALQFHPCNSRFPFWRQSESEQGRPLLPNTRAATEDHMYVHHQTHSPFARVAMLLLTGQKNQLPSTWTCIPVHTPGCAMNEHAALAPQHHNRTRQGCKWRSQVAQHVIQRCSAGTTCTPYRKRAPLLCSPLHATLPPVVAHTSTTRDARKTSYP